MFRASARGVALSFIAVSFLMTSQADANQSQKKQASKKCQTPKQKKQSHKPTPPRKPQSVKHQPPPKPQPKPPVLVPVIDMHPSNLVAPQVVQFSALKSKDLKDKNFLKKGRIQWDFGDGSHGDGVLAQHIYRHPGSYKVVLTLSEGSYHASANQTITVKQAQNPVAVFSATQETTKAPFKFKFDGSASYNPDGDHIARYIWDFGDGSKSSKEDLGYLAKLIQTILDCFFPAADKHTAVEHSYKKAGSYQVQLTVVDTRGRKASVTHTINVNSTNNQPPVIKLVVKPATSGVAPFLAIFDASGTTTTSGGALTYKFDFGDGTVQSSNRAMATHSFMTASSYTVQLTVTDVNSLSSSTTASITVTAPVIPAAPVAPPMAEAAPQSIDQQISFIYSGSNPVQTGVLANAIDSKRSALIHGKVFDSANNALSGVTVSVLNHPELGQTLSRADGQFDLVVNSGDMVTLNYDRGGYSPVQRKIRSYKQDYFSAPDVMMVAFDSKATVVQMGGASVQVHKASTITDSDGTRTGQILFRPGTTANLIMPNGSSVAVPQLTVRATEFTVGDNGPKMMPGELPQNTAYTYAAELSADEALALGATTIQFSKPVNYYIDDFINVPVGIAVPLGIYNKAKGYWEPDHDGVVIKILAVSSGVAQVDVDGSGHAATSAQLTAWGFDNDELGMLASNYAIGATLMRFRLNHFSDLDANMGGASNTPHISNSIEGTPPPCLGPDCNKCHKCVIDLSRRVWKETIPLLGSGEALAYASDRSLGYAGAAIANIQLLTGDVPDSLSSIEVEAKIAGRTVVTEIDPRQTVDYTFNWDGFDVFGRQVTQPTMATITLRYFFQSEYFGFPAVPDGSTFNSPIAPNASAVFFPSRNAFELIQDAPILMNPPFYWISGRTQFEVAGWAFSQHHQYDIKNKRLIMGDGSVIDANTISPVVHTIVGGGSQLGDGGLAINAGLAIPVYYRTDAEGSAYVSDYGNSRIRKIDLNGNISTAVGTGDPGNSGDGGLATAAQIGMPVGITFDTDGNLYFCDAAMNVIRRVDKLTGIITRIAGTGEAGYSGDGGPALQAKLNGPLGLFFMPDGSLLFSDSGNNVLRQIMPGGTIRTYAGTGHAGFSGDGGPALAASFNNPDATYFDRNGSIYIVDTNNNRIRKISPGGVVTTVVGTGIQGFSGDRGPATSANINTPINVVVSDRGEIYFTDSGNHCVRYVDLDGKIKTIAGQPLFAGFDGGDQAADKSVFNFPAGLFLNSDDTLVIADSGNNLIRRMESPTPITGTGQIAIPSPDGTEIYLFDAFGKHLQTLFAKTGKVKWQFVYDSNGLLISLTDASGNLTQVVRNSSGQPSEIVGPFGQVYSLVIDSNGYLKSLTEPTGETYQLTMTNVGQVVSFKKPSGSENVVTYDLFGTLVDDKNALGGLTRIYGAHGLVSATSPLGRYDSYKVKAVPWTLSTWQMDATSSDGSTKTSVSAGATTTTDSVDGEIVSHNGFDPRLKSITQFTDGQLLTTPSGRSSYETTSRNYIQRDAFDFDVQETFFKDGQLQISKTFSTSNLTTSVVTGGGRTSKTVIDQLERPIQTQSGNFTPVTYSYDSRGRISRLAQGTRVTTFGYDNQGYLNLVTDSLGRSFGFTNDASGRIVTQTLPDGRQIGAGYDLNSNLNAVRTPANLTHSMSFNPLDLLGSYLPPLLNGLAMVTNFNYNVDGDLSSVVRPDSQTVNYQYDDPYLRLKRVGTSSVFQNFGYDSRARLASSGSSDGVQINYSYDGSLPLSRQYSSAAGVTSVSLMYTNPGLLVASRSVGSNSVNLVYDQDQTLIGAGDLGLSRDPGSGLVTALSNGSVSESLGYNTFSEIISKQAFSNSSSIYSETLVRDDIGRITRKTEVIGGSTNAYDYTYDLSGRLTDVALNGSSYGHYTYDLNSNRVSATVRGNAVASSYDAQDRIVSYGANSYAFTNNGDLATKTNADGLTKYVIDVFGQLKSVSLPSGQVIAYLTDGEGHRFERMVNGSIDRFFVYNELGQLVGELNSNGSLRSHFVYASQAHSPDYMIQNGVSYQFIKDHLGSVRLVVNAATGAVEQRIDYDEFGVVLSDTNPGFQPFSFAGGLYDSATHLIHFGVRDYDPVTGRWTSKDPILFKGGDTNLYGYTMNDPVNFIDPIGLWSFTIGGYNPFTGLGGGITFGRNPNGSWFGGVWGGGGYGGGFSFNPDGTSPEYQPGQCRNGPSVDIGAYANIGANVGPFSGGVDTSGGVNIGGQSPGYFNLPGNNGGASNTRGIGFGGGAGIQVIGVW